ncbi:hypothetical protein QLX08_007371 [Tetragonisca angustula]|uniref:Transmembrane protein 186 n=1 Tax=Tetragonisca angustula TaxID=166442 RepID=A0AAW0ZPU5_9HYME
MNLLTVHFRKQFRYCFYNSINNTIKYYHASNKEYNNVSPLPQSRQFPDYTVLYFLPMATIPYVFNKIKRNYTFVVGATIPICVSLQILGFIPLMDNLAFISCNCILAATLHTIGSLCNNIVGAIYIKEDEKDKENLENQKIIISYISYWGQRVDLKTTADNILPFAEDYTNASNDFFKTLQVKSSNQKFKVYLKYGKITGPKNFYNIFG